MSEKKENIVANTSKAYGYNYASLGDIALQGFKIPKMKTGTEDGKEYVFYYDTDLKEWIRGAEIVVPENIITRDGKNKMNSAQLYGSALTYARRYTTLMALSLVCDEDKKLEAQSPSGIFDEPIKGLKDLANEFRKVVPQDIQEKILADLKITKAEDIGMVNLQRYLDHYGKK